MIFGVVLVTMMLDLTPAFVTAAMVSAGNPVEDVDNGDTNKLKLTASNPVEIKRRTLTKARSKYECVDVIYVSKPDLMACTCEPRGEPSTYDFTENKAYFKRKVHWSITHKDLSFYAECEFLFKDYRTSSFFYARIEWDGHEFIKSNNSFVRRKNHGITRPAFINRHDSRCQNPLRFKPKDKPPKCENNTYNCGGELRNRELNHGSVQRPHFRLRPSSVELTNLADWAYRIIKFVLERPHTNWYHQKAQDISSWKLGVYGGRVECDHVIELQTVARGLADFMTYSYPWETQPGNDVLEWAAYVTARIASNEFVDLAFQFTHSTDNLVFIDKDLNTAKRNMNNEKTCDRVITVHGTNPKMTADHVREYYDAHADMIIYFIRCTVDEVRFMSDMNGSPDNIIPNWEKAVWDIYRTFIQNIYFRETE